MTKCEGCGGPLGRLGILSLIPSSLFRGTRFGHPSNVMNFKLQRNKLHDLNQATLPQMFVPVFHIVVRLG